MSDVVSNPANALKDDRSPVAFAMPLTAVLGLFFGYLVGQASGNLLVGLILGAAIGAGAAYLAATALANNRTYGRLGIIALCGLLGLLAGGLGGLVGGAFLGAVLSWVAYWLASGDYRRGVPPYATSGQVLWHNAFRFICGLIFFFLIAPIIVIIPLSFNAQDFFTFTPEMLRLSPEGYSLKHYRDFLELAGGSGGHPLYGILGGVIFGGVIIGLRALLSEDGPGKVWPPILIFGLLGLLIGALWGAEGDWISPLKSSLTIAPAATALSVALGTLAAIGLSQSHVPGRQLIMAIMISPMIVPLIISAAGMYFFYSRLGLQGTWIGVVLAHAALGIPFVIITVTATLVGFDRSLTRASANLGANPVRTFFKVQMPLILPGVISGALFAFITSFDEVVVVLFVGSAGQKTLPWQMFIGLREQISPTILAVATILVVVSIALLTTVELLRRRSERLRGMSPG